MDGAAVDLLGRIRQGQRQTPVDQAAKQQIEVGAILLDVGFQSGKHSLIVVIRRVVDIFHVGIVQLEDAETTIKGSIGVVLCDLFCSSTDSFFSEF